MTCSAVQLQDDPSEHLAPIDAKVRLGRLRERVGCGDKQRARADGLLAQATIGGEGGIRTPVPVTRQDAFEAPPLRPLRYLS